MIIVGTPTRGEVLATFTTDLIGLLSHSPGTEWRSCIGSILSNNRTLLVHVAAEQKASHILFIDSDMRFPANTLNKLLAHKKDIIGANNRQRNRDLWTARAKNDWLDSTDKTGIEEVDSLGFGVILIDMNVFTGKLRSVPLDAFKMPFNDQGIFDGEDINFCREAKLAGFKIWVDHDLSKEVKHSTVKEI